MRLCGIAENGDAVLEAPSCEGYEVYLGGDSVQAGQPERIAVAVVAVMAHQLAAVAFPRVMLLLWRPVAEQENALGNRALVLTTAIEWTLKTYYSDLGAPDEEFLA